MDDRNPAEMSAEDASAYFLSLAREGEDEDDDEASLVFVQRQIDDFNTRLEQAGAAGAAGVGLNPADEQLIRDLQSLREKLEKPTFFEEMNKTFREPLQREFLTRVYPELQDRFQFNKDNERESPPFDTRLQECLLEMLSARQFYTELGFLAFFKRSFFRLFAGVGCTYFEAEFALTIASSIINNALFTATLSYVPDMSTIIGALNNAYQSCSKENIITFLSSLGVDPAAAPQIYDKIKDFSKEQIKFVLKCFFLKRVVGGIQSAEHPGSAPAQRPPPTFFQMISRPLDLLEYLRSIGPSGVAGIAGAPNLSLPGRAITSFREIMDSIYPGIIAQLNTVFPDTADDEIKMILFKLLLNLNDDSTEEDIGLALSVLGPELYRCIEAKYSKKMDSAEFRELCKKVCPGLLVGLSQETVERVYGQSIQDSLSSTDAFYGGDSPKKYISDDELRQGIVSRAMSALGKLPRRLAELAEGWFGGWFERTTKPDQTKTRVSIRGDATLQFILACEAIKKKIPTKYAKHIDTVLNAFKHTVYYDDEGNLKLSDTDYEEELNAFNDSMTVLSTITHAPNEVLDMLRKFQNAAWEQYSGHCELLSSMSVPFLGNTTADTLHTTLGVLERMDQRLQSMIVSSDAAVFNIQQSITEEDASVRRKSNFSGFGPASASGGRSRSRKRSVSKRTRRKGVAKKQKSKKNKRQSRRKVRRASSRRSRK